jgi:hypothetical protein
MVHPFLGIVVPPRARQTPYLAAGSGDGGIKVHMSRHSFQGPSGCFRSSGLRRRQCLMAAWAAASRATGTRNGLQLT